MEPVSTMTAIITAISSLVTAIVGWVTDYVGLITASGNEVLLLMCVAIPVAGIGVGMLRRLLSVN